MKKDWSDEKKVWSKIREYWSEIEKRFEGGDLGVRCESQLCEGSSGAVCAD